MAPMARLLHNLASNPNSFVGNCHLSEHVIRGSAFSVPISSNAFTVKSSLNLKHSENRFLKVRAMRNDSSNAEFYTEAGGGGGSFDGGSGSGGGGGGGGEGGRDSSDGSSSSFDFGPLGFLITGWRSRVLADPQFPFKVLMEELVGVTACVLGDMASRPNFGLNELDFVFSTLVVGSILNFLLMYLLAPTGSDSASLPSIFACCPKSHMFEVGNYGFLDRFGTFVYKGLVFAVVGFCAGLTGTAISNGLIKIRKKMDPNFDTPNKPPPTLLNSLTWALHMGISSNFRYQTLNGLEFLLAKWLPSVVFKSSVIVLRCANNTLGGASFVMLARLTGSQKSGKENILELSEEKQRLVDSDEDLQRNQSSLK